MFCVQWEGDQRGFFMQCNLTALQLDFCMIIICDSHIKLENKLKGKGGFQMSASMNDKWPSEVMSEVMH